MNNNKNKLNMKKALIKIKDRYAEKDRDRKSNPLYFRSIKDKTKVVDLLNTFRKVSRAQYLYAMIHPEVAVQQGYQVKMYSDVPVPSSSIGFKTTYQVSTSPKGTFSLVWTPNFMVNKQVMEKDQTFDLVNGPNKVFDYSNISINNSSTLSGEKPDNLFAFYPSYIPDIALQKYRLVSALIRVVYNGSVLNQAGTMYSCATFDQMCTATVGQTTMHRLPNIVVPMYKGDALYSTGIVNLPAARYGDFNLVRNGLWNRSVNITENASGIECLYVPMDPSDHMFYPVGDYYGLGSDTFIKSAATPTNYDVGVNLQTSNEGAHINYVIAGQNLPISLSCIYIEVYSNFEVIADPSSAPVIRSSIENAFDQRDNELAKDLTLNMTKNGMLTRVTQPNKPDWADKLNDFIHQTFKVGKTVWPIVSKFFI